eukprot:scaffold4481_cov121-Cylindrotheca_fusiformis.AAC.3
MKVFLATCALCLSGRAVAFLFPPLRTSSIGIITLNAETTETESELLDLTGKTVYQRSFYRLTPGSQVSKPNAIVLEERLRFQPDPERPDYILPVGPRTYIFRQGTSEDEITDPLYRFDLGSDESPHNGPGTLDTDIATALWIASNPELVQGDVLQLGCESGAASVLGCIGAKLVLGEKPEGPSESPEILTVPKHENIFPEKVHQLTLSAEDQESLRPALDLAQSFQSGEITLKDLRWSVRLPPGRRYDRYYRTIVGSDIDFNYPNSKQLARTVANLLLPSDEFAIASMENGGSSSSSSFGGLGMDLGESTESKAKELDSSIPPNFVHVAPETRENLRYLKQFLEKGFRMTIDSGYFNMERLNFVFQTLEEGKEESELEELDTLELKDDMTRGYYFIRAIHHPDYAGDGTGEYFFPLETGEYESGSRSTWLEPEEGGSLL